MDLGTSLIHPLGGCCYHLTRCCYRLTRCCYHLTRFGAVLKICSSENDLNTPLFKFTDALVGFPGGGDGTLALVSKLSKIKYISTKLIYSQMQGLKVRILQDGTDVCLL